MRRVSSRAGNLEAKPVEESPHAWDGAAGSCDSFRVPIQGASRDERGVEAVQDGASPIEDVLLQSTDDCRRRRDRSTEEDIKVVKISGLRVSNDSNCKQRAGVGEVPGCSAQYVCNSNVPGKEFSRSKANPELYSAPGHHPA